jgi:PadR family transcriptional regulator, regulatory protein PadR
MGFRFANPGFGADRKGFATRQFPPQFLPTLLDNLGERVVFLDTLGKHLMDKQLDLLQGTLDMLILKAVSLSPLHGYGILLRIQQISKERLEIQQGSLYPALYRLEHHGWITSEWGESENKRRARYYRLTAAGKRRLQSEAERWNQMTAVIAGILQTTPEEL